MRGLNLGTQSGPKTRIIDTNFTFVEVQNATNWPVVIPRKAQLGKALDYEKKSCYAIDAEEAYLAARASWPKQKLTATTVDTKQGTTEKH